MAPIEPDLTNSNVRPLSLFFGYLGLASGLVSLLSYRVLWQSYSSLPPSQATRLRASNRRRHAILFSLLAWCSLAATWYHLLSYFFLSYRVWAHEMGEDIPQSLYGEHGILGKKPVRLALGRWLKDTSVLKDAWEIVIERSGRFWWTQQLFLAAGAWAVFLGLEGRKRNIPHLWAFMLLAQTVALSLAMNMLFITILLKPISLASKDRQRSKRPQLHSKQSASSTPKAVSATVARPLTSLRLWIDKIIPFLPQSISESQPPAWVPHPLLLVAPLFVVYTCTFLLPFSTSTPSFLPLLLTPFLALYRPVYIDRFIPSAYGSIDNSRRSHITVYRVLSYASFLLYAKQTFVALLDNDPGAYEHRHSSYLTYLRLHQEHGHSAVGCSKSALARVLGALGDHPAVASVGWDVIMCGISLVAWAIIRGLDLTKIASAAGLATNSKIDAIDQTVHSNHGNVRASSATLAEADQPKSTKSRRRRKSSSEAKDAGAEDENDGVYARSNVDGPISAGDEELPENLEAGAVGWALLAAGGLGVAAAGILGAESDR